MEFHSVPQVPRQWEYKMNTTYSLGITVSHRTASEVNGSEYSLDPWQQALADIDAELLGGSQCD